MPHIDYYFSPLSPFAYLAGAEMEEIAARHGATIAYKPVDAPRLMVEMGGLPVPKRHPARQAYRLQELPRIARARGMPINVHPAHWPTDASGAVAALAATELAGAGTGALSRALLTAVWAEEKNIAEAAVLDEALAKAGVDKAKLDLAAGAAQIEANTAEAMEAGVFGFPFYIVAGERFWGQDRLSYLDAHLGSMNANA